LHFKLIDTHTHLCDPAFDLDREAVIERARKKSVYRIIMVSENIADAKKNIELSELHSELMPSAGLYPTCLDLVQAEEMHNFIRENHAKLVGIGEVGLDFWAVKKDTDRDLQREIFKSFISLSLELDLPLNIHSRSAGRHVVGMLLKQGATKVQLHAFDGKFGTAIPAVEAGYFFSIPPSIVRSRQKQKLVKQLPLSCLLVETDSPVLGPEPDKRNEPANISVCIEKIAELKNLSKQEVCRAVVDNTKQLYGSLIS